MKPMTVAPLALACLITPVAAAAAEFCVDTPAELQIALIVAAGNGEDDVIRVEPGNYQVPAGGFQFDGELENHDLVLTGGWRTIGIPPNVLPCVLRDRIDPRQTQIHGGTTIGNLWIHAGTGSIQIDGFMFAGGVATGPGHTGGAYVQSEGDITVEYNLFVGNHGFWAGGMVASSHATVEVVNNLFLGNSSDIAEGAATIGGVHGWITHNGFVANSGALPAVYALPIASPYFVLTNNLIWDNSPSDLDFPRSGYPAPVLIDDLVGSLSLIAGDINPGSTGNIDSDPLFSAQGNATTSSATS